jgi:hypothetical protein
LTVELGQDFIPLGDLGVGLPSAASSRIRARWARTAGSWLDRAQRQWACTILARSDQPQLASTSFDVLLMTTSPARSYATMVVYQFALPEHSATTLDACDPKSAGSKLMTSSLSKTVPTTCFKRPISIFEKVLSHRVQLPDPLCVAG